MLKSKHNKVGGFVTYNNGFISNCYTYIKLNAKGDCGGFCYTNNGEIRDSFANNKSAGIKGGFCAINKSTISECFWITDQNNNSTKLQKIIDADLSVLKDNKFDDVQYLKSWNFDSKWTCNGTISSLSLKKPEREEAQSDTDIIKISKAEQLINLARSVNEGEEKAVFGKYILEKDINLHGKTINPIGIDENNPFCGLFDGNGYKIYNFNIKCSEHNYSGFFGYVQKGEVKNLTIDCTVNGRKGNICGGMCGINDEGRFSGCTVITHISQANNCGGFVGKNAGYIDSCCVIGSIVPVIPLSLIWGTAAACFLIFASLMTVSVINALPKARSDELFAQLIVDPNQTPLPSEETTTAAKGDKDTTENNLNKASFEFNQSLTVSKSTMIGKLQIKNPARSDQNFVASITISADELKNKIGYSLDDTEFKLYKSGLIQVGYGVENVKLSALPDGTNLPTGKYTTTVLLEFYNTKTNEKSIITSQLPLILTIK